MKFRYILAGLLGTLLIAGTAYAVSEIKTLQTAVEEDWQPKMIAGIIEANADGQWTIMDEPYHDSTGFSSLIQGDSYLTVVHSYTTTKVVTSSVLGDEVFASLDYHVGNSVGFDRTNIYIYDKNGNRINPATITNTKANIWIFNIVE